MKRSVIWLVLVLPAISLAMGLLLYFLANQNPDLSVEQVQIPLSKTSWRKEQ